MALMWKQIRQSILFLGLASQCVVPHLHASLEDRSPDTEYTQDEINEKKETRNSLLRGAAFGVFIAATGIVTRSPKTVGLGASAAAVAGSAARKAQKEIDEMEEHNAQARAGQKPRGRPEDRRRSAAQYTRAAYKSRSLSIQTRS